MVGAKKTLKYLFISHSSRKISLEEVICKMWREIQLDLQLGSLQKA